MKWIKDCGREYTIALSAEYTAQIDNECAMWEAEDIAWNLIEEAYKKSDVNEYEVYETLDIRTGLFGGYFVDVKVNTVVYAIGHDINAAYNEAVDLIENISLPEGVKLNGTEQTKLIEVGDRVEMVVGE